MKPIFAVSDGASPAGSTELAGERENVATPMLLQNWQVVLRWKWVIAGILVASLAAGVLITFLMHPKYTATARVEISREQKNITKVEGVDPTDARQDLEFYQTQYSLLEARSLAERVARDLRLASRDDFFASHDVDPGAGIGSAVDRQKRREKIAVGLLLKNISITPIRQSSLVDVSYRSGAPAISAEIANSWVRQFIQASLDRRFESTADARKFLEGRLSDLRGRVENSERDAVNYAADRGIVTLDRTTSAEGRTTGNRTLASADLEALNSALSTAIAERVAAESRARQSGSRGASAEALANPAIATLRQRRAEVSAEYARTLVQFEPEYPAAKALAEQLRNLDASIAREENRVSSSRDLEYRQALQREQELRAAVDALKGNLENQQRNSIQFNIYQREAETNRQLYDSLLQRYKEIGVAGVAANNIAIVDVAQVPERPTSPNLMLNLALALLTGIVAAAGVTFIINQIDESLREPSQVSNALKVPLLGSVPDVEDQNALELLADAKTAVSEAYLTIRSSLAFSTDHGIPKTFMVTSTRAAEGKSTSCFALAVVLGRTGKRVVLIDGDMRSPSVHGFAAVSSDHGLSNALSGAEDWRSYIHETSFRGLSVLPAGPVPPSAAELLSGDRIVTLVQQLSEMYDHVVIDSPPILGLADAPLLSRAVEGCVFVVEADGVSVRGIRAALDRLRAVHAHIYGAVLTKLKSKQAGYGYGYDYGYGYGQTYRRADS